MLETSPSRHLGLGKESLLIYRAFENPHLFHTPPSCTLYYFPDICV